MAGRLNGMALQVESSARTLFSAEAERGSEISTS